MPRSHALRHALAAALASLLLAAGAAEARAEGVTGGIDLFELHPAANETHLVAESTWAVGAGLHSFALKLDGGSDTRPAFEDVETQLLWMPEVSRGVKLAVGARQDLRPGANLSYAVAGVEAQLLPWLAGEHYFFLSDKGDLTGSAKLTASFRLAGALTLEPRAQVEWAARSIPAEELSGGATGLELSARLRHPVAGGLNVYVGAIHERVIGPTAALTRSNGGATGITRAVIGAGLTL